MGQDPSSFSIGCEVNSSLLPPLVDSNACLSGLEASWEKKNFENQVFGLASSLLASGVSYIGTLWSVTVRYSTILAIEFFIHSMSGVPFGESLRRARIKIYKTYGELTGDWAAFLLYGNPEEKIDWDE